MRIATTVIGAWADQSQSHHTLHALGWGGDGDGDGARATIKGKQWMGREEARGEHVVKGTGRGARGRGLLSLLQWWWGGEFKTTLQ